MKANKTALKHFIFIRLTTLVLISMSIIATMMYILVIKPTQTTKIIDLHQQAEISRNKINAVLKHYELKLLTIADVLYNRSDSCQPEAIIRNLLRSEPSIYNFLILNNEGKLQHAYKLDDLFIGVDLAKLIPPNLHEGEVSIAISPTENHIHAILKRKKEILILGIDLQEFTKLANTTLKDEIHQVIFDKDRKSIYKDYDIVVTEPGKIINTYETTSNGHNYPFERITVYNQSYVQVSTLIDPGGLDWLLCIRLPVNHYYKTAYTYYSLLGTLVLLFLGSGLILLKNINKQLVNPINQLSNRLLLEDLKNPLHAQDFPISEVHQLYENYQIMLRNLLEKEQKLKEFVYIASHDLQEPLRVITNYIRIIEMEITEQLDPECQKYLNYVSDGARRMKKLIEELLAYSRASEKPLDIKRLSIAKIMAKVENSLSRLIAERQAIIEFTGQDEINADENGLEMLLQNLINNAIKFNDNQPQVKICYHNGTLTISDNGIGIDEKYFDKIMKPFSRLHTNAEYKGTGIGMAIVQKIIERHQWHFDLSSTLGQGTTINITTKRG